MLGTLIWVLLSETFRQDANQRQKEIKWLPEAAADLLKERATEAENRVLAKDQTLEQAESRTQALKKNCEQ